MHDLRSYKAFYAMSLLLILLASTLPVVQAQEAEWTFIMFSASDNDLEGEQMMDINEMEWIGSSEAVNLVVQIDRATGYDDTDGDWTDTRRYYLVEDAEPESITSAVTESLGETNAGDPQVLIDYVLWAIDTYPAQKYALVLEDHGGGWTGFGWDESHNYDELTMLEIDQALQTITETAGIQFELIGFDACLMSQYDVVKMLAPYGQYALVASETEPGFGWAYDMFLPYLLENPGMDGAELGQYVVDSYMEFYTTIAAEYDYDQFDLNVIDLREVPEVDVAINAFARVVQDNAEDVMSAIGDARNNAQIFGASTNPDEADYFSSIDLIHFLKLLVQITDNDEIRAAATELMDALGALVVYHQASDGLPHAYGMAIYFPRNQRIFTENNADLDYPTYVPYQADWQSFLYLYYGKTVAAIPPTEAQQAQVVEIIEVFPDDILSIHNPPVITFHLDGKDILEVSYSATLIGDDFQIMVDQSPLESASVTPDGDPIIDYPDEPSDYTYAWEVEMPVVKDAAISIPTLLLSDRSSPDTVTVSGLYIPQNGGAKITAYLLFDLETQQVKSVWGSSAGGGAPYEIKPKVGDQFLPTWRYLDENKEYALSPADSEPLKFSDKPFTFAFEPAPSGRYDFTVRVEDIAGNLYTDTVTLEVDNEGLDAAWRGFTDTDFGIYFQYPWDWPGFEVVEYEDAQQLLLSSPDGDVNIRIDMYEAGSNEDMLDAALEYIESYEDVEIGEPEETYLGDYDAYATDYWMINDDGTELYSFVLSVYVPDTEVGYLIEFEVWSDAAFETAEAAYMQLADTIEFFDPVWLEE